MKQFIKLNDYSSHLSLGNIILCIKDLSKNKTSTIQSEVFCAIFNILEANNSTINNYCIGARRIGDEYKQIYISLQKKYKNDNSIMKSIVKNILTLIQGSIYNDDLFKSKELILLCKKLFNISKNDFYVDNDIILIFKTLIEQEKYYECFCEMLMYAILEKKQPLYESEKTQNIIETLLEHTEISALDLQNFLLLELNEGVNFTHSIMNLAFKGNPYANYRLGVMEYRGEFSGNPRYDKAYEYLLVAANKNHPSAIWMIGNMILNEKISTKNEKNLKLAYQYFLKAKALGNIAAVNSLGLCYKYGYGVKTDKKQALKYFTEAAEKGYAYAYNNLGLIYEEEGNIDLAYRYFYKSAEMNESFSCNKIGELMRKKGNKKEAFTFYQKALSTGINGQYPWALYNLAKYYYLDGCMECNIIKNKNQAIEYFKQCESLIESLIELFYLYFDSKNMEQVNIYKEKIEKHSKYNSEIKKTIEVRLSSFKKITMPK